MATIFWFTQIKILLIFIMENKYLWSGWPSYASLFSTFPELRQTLLPRVGITDTIAPCRHPELNEARYESRDVDVAGWSHAARRRCNPRF